MDAPKFRIETVRPRKMRSKLMTVRLNLAREPEHPDGSSDNGYAFTAPLDPGGRLDAGLWTRHRGERRVTRFSPDGPSAFGLLAHRRGEAGGATWGFEFDAPAEEVDLGFRLDLHRFRSGVYVTVSHLGKDHTHTGSTPSGPMRQKSGWTCCRHRARPLPRFGPRSTAPSPDRRTPGSRSRGLPPRAAGPSRIPKRGTDANQRPRRW